MDNNKDKDELNEEELEQATGGLNSNSIKLCNSCNRRIAVFGMEICASCFREQNI